MVEDAKAGGPASLEVLRMRARVLATQPSWRAREEALKRFADLECRQVLTADDRFVMARLFEAKAAWPQAREQLGVIETAPDARPHHLAYFAQSLLRQGERGRRSACWTGCGSSRRRRPAGPPAWRRSSWRPAGTRPTAAATRPWRRCTPG